MEKILDLALGSLKNLLKDVATEGEDMHPNTLICNILAFCYF